MDSIDDGATIRIGFDKYDKRFDDVPYDFILPTYSLKINKKSIVICGCAGPAKNYLEIYANAGKKIAQLMNEHAVKKYVIYNVK